MNIHFCRKFEVTIRYPQIRLLLNLLPHLPSYIWESDYTSKQREISFHHLVFHVGNEHTKALNQ